MLRRSGYAALVLAVLLYCLFPLSLFAQTTRTDALIQKIKWCNSHISDPAVLPVLDSLNRVAESLNDDSVTMQTYILRVTHYYQRKDEQNMLKSFNQSVEWNRRKNLDYGVFLSWSRLVMYYTRQNDYKKVASMLQKMRQDAQEMNSPYGLMQSYSVEGAGLYNIKQYNAALDCYLKAERVGMQNKGKPNVNLSYIHTMLGQTYNHVGDYDNAIKYLHMAIEESGGVDDRQVGAYIYLYRASVRRGDLESARRYKYWLDNTFGNKRMLVGMKSVYDAATVEYYLLKNDADSAEIVLNSMSEKRNIPELLPKLSACRGNYEAAYRQLEDYAKYNDSMDLNSLVERIGLFVDSTEAQEMALANLRLERENHRLLVEQAENHRQLQMRQHIQDTLLTYQMRLALEKEQSASRRLEKEAAEHSRQEEVARQLDEQQRRTNRYYVIGGAVAFLFMALLLTLTLFSITKIQAQKKRIRQAMEKAQLTDRMKSVFLQNMNHEIRAPLASIVSFSDLLNSPEIQLDAEERKELQQNLHANTDLLLTLINDVIDLTTLQSGNYKVEYSDVNLSVLCRTAVASNSIRCPEGVEMVCKVPEQDVVVRTDYNRVLQVINNLLSNACKYTSEGSIRLSYFTTPDYAEIVVVDTGTGIPSHQAKNIFNRFEKIGSVKKGFGLGLSICQSVIGLLGGIIWLDTSYQKGACFRFRLPLRGKPLAKESKTIGSGLRMLLCALVLSFATVAEVRAQNNPYLLPDDVYEYFLKTQESVRSNGKLEMVDTLMRMGRSRHDLKAQCLAWVCRFEYYQYTTKDKAAMERVNDELIRFCRNTPYTQYCFVGYNGLISHTLTTNDYISAQRYIKDMTKLAFELDSSYGISRTYLRMGDYYFKFELFDRALAEYTKARDYCLSSNATNEIITAYTCMALSYSQLKDKEKMEENIRLALESAKSQQQMKTANVNALTCYANVGDYDGGMPYLDNIRKLKSPSLTPSNRNTMYHYQALHLASHGQYEEARKYTDSMRVFLGPHPADGLRLYLMKKEGRYEDAYRLKKIMIERQDSLSILRNAMVYKGFISGMDNVRLQLEKEKLEISNQDIMLQYLQDEERLLAVTRQQDALLKEQQEKELLLSRERSAEKRREREIYQQEEMNRRRIVAEYKRVHDARLTLLFGLIILMLVSLLIMLILRYRFMRSKTRAEAALRQAEEADRQKTLFLQDMNHEIRTPLNAIVGYTDLLNQADELCLSQEEISDMGQLVHQQSAQLLQLVNEILDLSKLESGTHVFASGEVDMMLLCYEAAALIRPMLSHGVELKVETQPAMPLLQGDVMRLRQLLENVLRNAAQHTTEGHILLQCSMQPEGTDHQYVRISVTDTGCGIPVGEEERIFHRFYKLDQFAVGFGLGLSTCQVILKQMGGHIWSVPQERGACFVMDFRLKMNS